jgi:hypothetical protein
MQESELIPHGSAHWPAAKVCRIFVANSGDFAGFAKGLQFLETGGYTEAGIPNLSGNGLMWGRPSFYSITSVP